MSLISKFGSRLAVLGLLFLPHLALAGRPGDGVVIVGPVQSTPVPSLSATGLIILALLLAVVAIRIFRNHQGAFNVLAVVALAGSVVSGGVGIERAWASGEIVVGGNVCQQAGPVNFDALLSINYLDNACPNAVQIIDISASCALVSEPVSEYGTCAEGDILLGSGADKEDKRCALRYCDD